MSPTRLLRPSSICVISVKAMLLLAVAALSMVVAQPAASSSPDWQAVSEVEEIQVLTAASEGELRETTIWLVVLDGRAFIRTSSRSGWGDDIERNSEIALRIEGEEYLVGATFIEDEDLRERVTAAFREKYGWSDGMISIFRGSTPRIMLVESRRQ